MQVEFSDFLEPNLIKTGHIIPLSCGHNGAFNKVELSIFEIHLTNAGFIVEPEIMLPEETEPKPQLFDELKEMDVQPVEGDEFHTNYQLESNLPNETFENVDIGSGLEPEE